MVAIEQAEAPPISRTEKLLRQMEALVEEMELARPPYDAHGFARNYAIAVTHLEDAMLRLRLAVDVEDRAALTARDGERDDVGGTQG